MSWFNLFRKKSDMSAETIRNHLLYFTNHFSKKDMEIALAILNQIENARTAGQLEEAGAAIDAFRDTKRTSSFYKSVGLEQINKVSEMLHEFIQVKEKGMAKAA